MNGIVGAEGEIDFEREGCKLNLFFSLQHGTILNP